MKENDFFMDVLPDIVIADAAGNTTALVVGAAKSARTSITRRLFAKKTPPEQIGFVNLPILNGGYKRLEMAGGEFCGNAARSFALFIAKLQGIYGQTTIEIEISGCSKPLNAIVDNENNEAEVYMPLPEAVLHITYKEKALPALIFDGITHVLIENVDKDTALNTLRSMFYDIKELVYKKNSHPAALGLMFYDNKKNFLRPAVYVSEVGKLVFESSCGSGSAALAYFFALSFPDGGRVFNIEQPGGSIKARTLKEAGRIRFVSIGGKVFLHCGDTL